MRARSVGKLTGFYTIISSRCFTYSTHFIGESGVIVTIPGIVQSDSNSNSESILLVLLNDGIEKYFKFTVANPFYLNHSRKSQRHGNEPTCL